VFASIYDYNYVILLCFNYYNYLLIIIMSLSTMSYLYQHIIQNREMRAIFLKIRGLLPANQTCTKIKNQTICSGELKNVLKISRKRDSKANILKTMCNQCTKKGCQTYHSIRKNNNFFTYKGKNGKFNSGLNLCDIVELVWY